jgi:heat shock protein HslJ
LNAAVVRHAIFACLALALCGDAAAASLGDAYGFPLDRRFHAVSLNGEPLGSGGPKGAPSFEARREGPLWRAFGSGGCNRWNGTVVFPAPHAIAIRGVVSTRMACPGDNGAEQKYLGALLRVGHWHTENDTLILEDGANILRLKPAPP